MKIRTNFVSNSSSSSFLVSEDISKLIPCIKLPSEIWEAMERNYIDWEGNKLDLSSKSNEWWLTSFISEWDDNYDMVGQSKNHYRYMDGHEEPYDWYDNPEHYTVFKKHGRTFYISNDDLFGIYDDDIPNLIALKNKLTEIIKNNKLNKSQKLSAITHFLDF